MGRPIAELRLIDGVHYRRDSFTSGLQKLGYTVAFSRPPTLIKPDDVLILWNRYWRDEARARAYETAGATVLITENAWIGPEEKDKHWFALCKNHHNGVGSWRVGDDARWDKFEIELKPWRTTGKDILVLPQRGMGERGVAQPLGWMQSVTERLWTSTTRPVRFRHHPGLRPHPEIDFENVWACVTWASGAAIKALIAGIPVFYELPHWIGAMAAVKGINGLERPFLGDRLPMFRQLAWAMWRNEELASGEAFEWLLCKSPSMSAQNSVHEKSAE